MQTANNQAILFGYGLIVFLSSAVVMVLEITAGRLLAPYIGVSLYSWTSIIGVVLAGLSFGGWLGGRWADAGANNRTAGIILVVSGIASFASLLMLTFVAPVMQSSSINLIGAGFLYMMALFFLPALLLGIITPLLTTLALKLDERAGHIVGRMHALAALGSILGTFITGYWLVQYIGTRNIIVGCGILLVVLGIPLILKAKKTTLTSLASALIITIGLTFYQNGYTNPCFKESSYFCIRIVDSSQTVPFGEARSMVLDHLIHGINHRQDPGMLISPYVQAMDELALHFFEPERAEALNYFFVGGGAYTLPRAVKHNNPNAQVTVAELDETVTKIAKEQTFLDDSDMRIFHKDARMVFHELGDEHFDVIINDVYHDISIPYHLVTQEYMQLAKQHLKEDGLFMLNIIDIFPNPQLVKSMVKTLQTEFKYVDIWLDMIPQEPTRSTYVISANNHHKLPDIITSTRGFQQRWFNISEPLIMTGTPLAELPTLTDDFAPVDRLIDDMLLGKTGL